MVILTIFLLMWVNQENVYGATSIITLTEEGIFAEEMIFLVKLFKFVLLLPFKRILYLNFPLNND